MSDIFDNVVSRVGAQIGRPLTQIERQEVGQEILSQVKSTPQANSARPQSGELLNGGGEQLYVVGAPGEASAPSSLGNAFDFLESADQHSVKDPQAALVAAKEHVIKEHGIDVQQMQPTIATSTEKQLREQFQLGKPKQMMHDETGQVRKNVKGVIGNDGQLDLMKAIRQESWMRHGITGSE